MTMRRLGAAAIAISIAMLSSFAHAGGVPVKIEVDPTSAGTGTVVTAKLVAEFESAGDASRFLLDLHVLRSDGSKLADPRLLVDADGSYWDFKSSTIGPNESDEIEIRVDPAPTLADGIYFVLLVAHDVEYAQVVYGGFTATIAGTPATPRVSMPDSGGDESPARRERARLVTLTPPAVRRLDAAPTETTGPPAPRAPMGGCPVNIKVDPSTVEPGQPFTITVLQASDPPACDPADQVELYFTEDGTEIVDLSFLDRPVLTAACSDGAATFALRTGAQPLAEERTLAVHLRSLDGDPAYSSATGTASQLVLAPAVLDASTAVSSITAMSLESTPVGIPVLAVHVDRPSGAPKGLHVAHVLVCGGGLPGGAAWLDRTEYLTTVGAVNVAVPLEGLGLVSGTPTTIGVAIDGKVRWSSFVIP